MRPGTVAAGIDIGNATTEVVLGRRVRGGGFDVLAADRVPTRGGKGSPASLDGASRLVERLARGCGVAVDVAAVAPLRSVETTLSVVHEKGPDTGRLTVVHAGAETAGGSGVGVGVPLLIDDAGRGSETGSVVAVVPETVDFRAALPVVSDLAAAGRLAAVVLARDEAVLLANRLAVGVPVVDRVPVESVSGLDRVAVEVRPPGTAVQQVADPLWLADAFGLTTAEREDAAHVAGALYDVSNAVVGVSSCSPERGDRRRSATSAALASGAADDEFRLDLAAIRERVLARRTPGDVRSWVVATLGGSAAIDAGAWLGERLAVDVVAGTSEALAAGAGALSTPGADPSTLVVDIGAGTIDVVTASSSVTVAGAGELLTRATAALLDVSPALAEWAKRGPAFRVESPSLLSAEDGTRVFASEPVPSDAVGRLVVDGPVGWLAFDRRHAPSEWRALRLAMKSSAVVDNVARAVSGLDTLPSAAVVVGGPAADEEVVACIGRALPGVAVGRGNIAGRLGHRYAVAYGLLLLAAGRPKPGR